MLFVNFFEETTILALLPALFPAYGLMHFLRMRILLGLRVVQGPKYMNFGYDWQDAYTAPQADFKVMLIVNKLLKSRCQLKSLNR